MRGDKLSSSFHYYNGSHLGAINVKATYREVNACNQEWEIGPHDIPDT